MLEMSREQVDEFLQTARVGHLGLAKGGSAYVVPLFFVFDKKDTVYFHSHPGTKDGYLRETKEACFTVTNAVSDDEWASVELFGPVAKIVSDPERLAAMEALMSIPFPPEWGLTPSGRPRRSDARSYFWKLTVARATGRSSDPVRHAITQLGLEADFATD